MALIGTIRKNGWILIGTMILALGGFILMDIVSNSQRYNAADANTLGSVNGKDIRSEDFERYKDAIYTNSTGNDFQVRGQVWNQFVEDAIIKEQAEEIGLGVGKDELKELQFGTNLSPVIAERFRSQAGQVDMDQLGQIKQAIESGTLNDEKYKEFRIRWSVQEDEVIKQRLQDKMMAMINKGIYAPTWQSEMAFTENNQRVDYLYVRVPYDKVPDSEIKVTDDDYASYLKENPKLYDQAEETRLVNYISFDVVPTVSDTAASREKLVKLIAGMKSKDDSLFVINNEGTYGGVYKSQKELPAAFVGAPLDSIIGPYIDGGSWTVAKILDRKVLPDSVRARHILLRGATPDIEQKIDSLKNLLSGGKVRFDSLAIRASEDGSAPKGGDLGFFANGAMVAEFNNVCFNTGEQGKVYKVQTQFGWHLIEITGKKFITNQTSVKAAYISELIRPSTATQQVVKDKALALIQSVKTLQELEAKAASDNLQLQVSQALKGSDFNIGLLGSGKDARDLVKWAFGKDTDAGDVAKQVFAFVDPNGGYYDSKYAVAALRSIAPKGSATVASLKANQQVEIEVKNRKKAEVLLAKLQGATDLAAAASAYGMTVDTAKSGSLMQVTVPKGGPEPRVLGTVFALKNGQISKPIAGKTGVYMVQPISEPLSAPAPAEMSMFRRQVVSVATGTVRTGLMNSLKKNANIKDNRVTFF
jgi:peptidyl-prolyl cis-trans isomerase D